MVMLTKNNGSIVRRKTASTGYELADFPFNECRLGVLPNIGPPLQLLFTQNRRQGYAYWRALTQEGGVPFRNGDYGLLPIERPKEGKPFRKEHFTLDEWLDTEKEPGFTDFARGYLSNLFDPEFPDTERSVQIMLEQYGIPEKEIDQRAANIMRSFGGIQVVLIEPIDHRVRARFPPPDEENRQAYVLRLNHRMPFKIVDYRFNIAKEDLHIENELDGRRYPLIMFYLRNNFGMTDYNLQMATRMGLGTIEQALKDMEKHKFVEREGDGWKPTKLIDQYDGPQSQSDVPKESSASQ